MEYATKAEQDAIAEQLRDANKKVQLIYAFKDLKDFTATFFQRHTLLNVLLHYSVFDVTNTLLVMRPYQIAATERILWKINSAHQAKRWSDLESGGFFGTPRALARP